MTITECNLCLPLPVENNQKIVLENDLCFFVQRPQNTLIGSGLIVPRKHSLTVFELTPAEWAATQALLLEVKNLLDSLHNPQGYNLGWNCGSVAGQRLLHTHLHVIPRYADEPLAGKGIRYWLKQENNKRSFP